MVQNAEAAAATSSTPSVLQDRKSAFVTLNIFMIATMGANAASFEAVALMYVGYLRLSEKVKPFSKCPMVGMPKAPDHCAVVSENSEPPTSARAGGTALLVTVAALPATRGRTMRVAYCELHLVA